MFARLQEALAQLEARTAEQHAQHTAFLSKAELMLENHRLELHRVRVAITENSAAVGEVLALAISHDALLSGIAARVGRIDKEREITIDELRRARKGIMAIDPEYERRLTRVEERLDNTRASLADLQEEVEEVEDTQQREAAKAAQAQKAKFATPPEVRTLKAKTNFQIWKTVGIVAAGIVTVGSAVILKECAADTKPATHHQGK